MLVLFAMGGGGWVAPGGVSSVTSVGARVSPRGWMALGFGPFAVLVWGFGGVAVRGFVVGCVVVVLGGVGFVAGGCLGGCGVWRVVLCCAVLCCMGEIWVFVTILQ